MSWPSSGLHKRVVDRLTGRAYDVPIMGNIERGGYVEVLVELALHEQDSAWSLTETWTPWDIEHASTGARVEVKQSAALQPWTPESERRKTTDRGRFRGRRFNIPPQHGYWGADAEWVRTKLQRMADVYVFGWHGDLRKAADQRRVESWNFYVVAERSLPELTKSISLGRVQGLAEPCHYDHLAASVQASLDELPALKVHTIRPA